MLKLDDDCAGVLEPFTSFIIALASVGVPYVGFRTVPSGSSVPPRADEYLPSSPPLAYSLSISASVSDVAMIMLLIL
jgi:hypothetical protein